MAWLNLKEEIEDMFSILPVPDMWEQDNPELALAARWGGGDVKNAYLAEYRKRPDLKPARAEAMRRYRAKPDVRAEINAKRRERYAAKKAA